MSLSLDIAGIRKEYKLRSFSETDAHINPIVQFNEWWNAAVMSNIEEYNAMTLCSVDSQNKPSARIVLLKGFDENGFVFYTNYKSRKGVQMLSNPSVALVFFWKELERQVRIEGTVSKTSDEVSDQYFHSRPVNSQLGAWASPQSEAIRYRDYLDERMKFYQKEFAGKEVVRPPHWGGFNLKPELIEFWQGRPSRLHDRIEYTLTDQNTWAIKRLAP